jgi:TRAP-type C4-dicarboxylate transport system permease small subunit
MAGQKFPDDVPKPGIAAQIGATIVMSGMVLCVGIQVLSRYLTHFGVSWTEEISRLFLVWAVSIGAILAVSGRAHFRMSLLSACVGPISQYWWDMIVLIGTTLFLIAFTYAGIRVCAELSDATSQMLGLSYAFPAASIPVGGFGMAIALWLRRFSIFSKPRN